MENNFNKLLSLNVNDKTEKKNGLTYLSWSWAWAEFCKVYPDAKYVIKKNEENMPVFGNEKMGYMVYTEVTAGNLTHEMWLPVMDFKNKSMTNPTTFDINKAIMRCLTKNLAIFGLGLYIYSGEDVPEEEIKAPEIPTKKTETKVSEENVKYIYTLITKTGFDKEKLYAAYKVQSMNDLTAAQATKVIEGLRKVEKEQEATK